MRKGLVKVWICLSLAVIVSIVFVAISSANSNNYSYPNLFEYRDDLGYLFDRPKVLYEEFDYTNLIQSDLKYNEIKLLDNETEFHNMTVEEYDNYLKDKSIQRRTPSSVEEYIIDTGSRMAAYYYRCRYTELKNGGIIFNNDCISILKPKFHTETQDYKDNTCKVYKSEIVYSGNKDNIVNGSIVASLYVIVSDDNTIKSMNMAESRPVVSLIDKNNILVSITGSAATDGSIYKVGYKIPMYEKAQYIGPDISLPMCNGAILASYLSSYRNVFIQPSRVATALYPVTYDAKNNLPHENIEKLKEYDTDIEYRDFTGITQYAVRDILKETDDKITMYTQSQMGYIAGLIAGIKNNKPSMITTISRGNKTDVETGRFKINIPTHIIMANGYIDNDIVVGFDPSLSMNTLETDSNPRMWMLHSNSVEHLMDVHIFIEGDTDYRLYNINDVIKSKNSIDISNQNQKKIISESDITLLDMQNLGDVIDTEFEYNVENGFNFKEELASIAAKNGSSPLLATIQQTQFTQEDYMKLHNLEYTEEELLELDEEERQKVQYELDRKHRMELLASALGITLEQFSRLHSGYTPYSQSIVNSYIKDNMELYTYVIIAKASEGITWNGNNFDFASALITFGEQDYTNSMLVLKKLLMYRKHPTSIVNYNDMEDTLRKVNSKKECLVILLEEIRTGKQLMYTVDSIERVILEDSNGASYGRYRVNLLNPYNTVTSKGNESNKYELPAFVDRGDPLTKLTCTDNDTSYIYKFKEAMYTPLNVTSSIRDNTYFSYGITPTFVN